ALHRGGLGRKIAPQRVAGRGRKGKPLNREVEVEIIDAVAVLHGVDDAEIRLDAQRPEILDERHVMRLERRLVEQALDADRLTLRPDPPALPGNEATSLPH